MKSYRFTIFFSFIGYVVQAIAINFSPLLFNTFEKDFGISLSLISLLIGISFTTQFLTDLLVAKFSKKLNLRLMCVLAHLLAVLGMVGFSFLPDVMPNPYFGLVIATVLAAVGSGFIEIVISPIVEACPTPEKKKSAMMATLHSFYSWGLAIVVLLSTVFFSTFGLHNWRILSALWAIIPFVGAIGFCFVPIYKLDGDKEQEGDVKTPSLSKIPIFWIFFGIMMCAGAAEQAMGQWASSFAETGLSVSKTYGDLLGPFAFAIFMGLSRILYSLFSSKIKLRSYMFLSSIMCTVSFLIVVFSQSPLLTLIGFIICGFSCGVLWPGTYSLAGKYLPYQSVSMFALLAFAGDLGCLVGPTLAGCVAAIFNDDLKAAFLFSVIFPVIMIVLLKFVNKFKNLSKKRT
ncbi:MAG: MFS transporter [Clostridia bacterium]|nr:MFS transporter [Clostridia bacterium]